MGPAVTPHRLSAAPTYEAVFSERGIPDGDFWSVNIVCNASYDFNSTGAYAPGNASIGLPNESCVAIGNGWGHGNPTPFATTFSVDGGPVALTINFTKASPTVDAIIFVEHGIGSGASWGVNLSGPVQNATVQGPYGDVVLFLEPAGSYNSTVFVGPGYEWPGGKDYNLSCSGPGATCVFFLYFVGVAEVTFHEVGLPNGTSWSVRVGSGLENGSTTGMIGFRLTDGQGYPFDVTSSTSLTPFPAEGTFNVSGAPVTIPITFERDYAVRFDETGLTPGTEWTVTLNATTNSSGSTEIGFALPNGTAFPFEVGAVIGFAATPGSGNVSVAGTPFERSIQFSPTPSPLRVRAWDNVTGGGGGGDYCLGETGQVGTHPAWENVSFAAVVWNGTPPYRASWEFGDGTANATAVRVVHTYAGFGSWTATLAVRDDAGTTNATALRIANAPPPNLPTSCPTGAGGRPGFTPSELGTFAAAIAALVAVGVLLLRRRSRARPPPSAAG